MYIGDKVKNIKNRRIGIVIRIFDSGSVSVLENISPIVINTHDSEKTLELIEGISVTYIWSYFEYIFNYTIRLLKGSEYTMIKK